MEYKRNANKTSLTISDLMQGSILAYKLYSQRLNKLQEILFSERNRIKNLGLGSFLIAGVVKSKKTKLETKRREMWGR